MILEKGKIPPNALFEKMNPKIDAKLSNLEVYTTIVQCAMEFRELANQRAFRSQPHVSHGHLKVSAGFQSIHLDLAEAIHTSFVSNLG